MLVAGRLLNVRANIYFRLPATNFLLEWTLFLIKSIDTKS